MDLQALTLHLPETTYQKLVELATQSERPVAEEAVRHLHSSLVEDTTALASIQAQFEQLSSLTDEELWRAAKLEAADEDNRLMQELLEKRQREDLKSTELETLQALSKRFNQIMMIRAKSTALLAERGHDISMLAPSA